MIKPSSRTLTGKQKNLTCGRRVYWCEEIVFFTERLEGRRAVKQDSYWQSKNLDVRTSSISVQEKGRLHRETKGKLIC